MTREQTELTQVQAKEAARIIQAAVADLTKTVCSIEKVILTNKLDRFWLFMTIGLCPFNEFHSRVWEQVEDKRETFHAHTLKLCIPQSALEPEPGVEREHHRLKAIGEALADVWWESRFFPELRRDRIYLIPYLEETIEEEKT